jgi:hypothetical protein
VLRAFLRPPRYGLAHEPPQCHFLGPKCRRTRVLFVQPGRVEGWNAARTHAIPGVVGEVKRYVGPSASAARAGLALRRPAVDGATVWRRRCVQQLRMPLPFLSQEGSSARGFTSASVTTLVCFEIRQFFLLLSFRQSNRMGHYLIPSKYVLWMQKGAVLTVD